MTTPITPITPVPPATAPAATPTTPTGGATTRLRNGELRAMVAKVLADNAGTHLTPRTIAHTLNRSSGAVGNACKALADRGEAEVASTTPLAYRATATTASAAASTIAPAPPRTPRPKSSPRAAAPATTPAPSGASGNRVRLAGVVAGPVKRPNGMDYHPGCCRGCRT